jgi:hypothetical protein
MSDTFLSNLVPIPYAIYYSGDGYVIEAYPDALDGDAWRWRIVTLSGVTPDPQEKPHGSTDEAHEAALDWIADRMAKIAEALGE